MRLEGFPGLPGLPWRRSARVEARHGLSDAVAESFFKTPKRAPAKGKGRKTREEAAQDIFKYIELYCSTVRMCSAHDYDSPVNHKQRIA